MTNKRNKRVAREEIFAREYIIDLNATRAAVAAGLAPKSAAVEASKLLRKPKVQALIAELTKDKLDKLEISADWVLGELRKLAGYDAGAIFNDVAVKYAVSVHRNDGNYLLLRII